MQIKRIKSKKKDKVPIMQILVIGYLTVVLIGAFLLWLPFSSRNAGFTPFLDAFFTAVSATCITGLTVVDTANYWSPVGEVIILFLIQIGALGFMSFASLILIFLRRKLTLRQRMLLQHGNNGFDMKSILQQTKRIVYFTFIMEAIGAILLSFQFIPEYGLGTGIWYSVFHSISAFCNAGFDLIATGVSLSDYQNNPLVLYTLMLLIVTGGLGFLVWFDLMEKRSLRKLSFHSKIVLTTTVILTIVSAVLIGAVEYFNPHALVDMDFFTAFNNVLFTAVTIRTAGFTTIQYLDFTSASQLIILLFIFIGGSPGSTAGGIKNTTFAVLFISVISFVKGRPYIEAFGRRIRFSDLLQSIVILVAGMSAILLGLFIMLLSDSSLGILINAFEVVSAFGTTGISLGSTNDLSVIGKCVIMLLMFLGRVGPLTIGLALASGQKKAKIKYPDGKILLG